MENTLARVRVLVIDDDSTSLSIVSAMLKKFRYEVVTIKNPLDTFSILRAHNEFFDLVLSDVHMPQMSGIELQRLITQEFNLPVVLMSSDERHESVVKATQNGAKLYMVKPISLNDLKNLWQHALGGRRGSKGVHKEDHGNAKLCKGERKNLKRPKARIEAEEDEIQNRVSRHGKKPKLVWTKILHNLFVRAVDHIGLDKAVPKKILEFMNVPGLTRENVASHLQKYRDYMKSGQHSQQYRLRRSWNHHPSKSKFTTSHVPFPSTHSGVGWSQNLAPQNATLNAIIPSAPNSTNGGILNTLLSRKPTTSQVGYGELNSLSSQANLHQTDVGAATPLFVQATFNNFPSKFALQGIDHWVGLTKFPIHSRHDHYVNFHDQNVGIRMPGSNEENFRTNRPGFIGEIRSGYQGNFVPGTGIDNTNYNAAADISFNKAIQQGHVSSSLPQLGNFVNMGGVPSFGNNYFEERLGGDADAETSSHFYEQSNAESNNDQPLHSEQDIVNSDYYAESSHQAQGSNSTSVDQEENGQAPSDDRNGEADGLGNIIPWSLQDPAEEEFEEFRHILSSFGDF